MKRRLLLITTLSLLTLVSAQAESSYTPIWQEGKMQGESAKEYKINKRGMVSAVKTPTIEYFTVKSDKPTPIVIICPGGGYEILAHTHEGTDITKWLNDNGISAAILRYRVPNYPDEALQDIQRAIRLVRSEAKNLNIAPDKIGVIGFSAGANLAARASTNSDKKMYEPTDDIDKISARPDYTLLIYPAYCDEQGNNRRWLKQKKNPNADYNQKFEIAKNLNISKDNPPVFIAQTLDDVYVDAAISYFLAAKEKGAEVSLHIFDKGRHGYGLAKDKGLLVSQWPNLAAEWIKDVTKNQPETKKAKAKTRK